MVYVSKKRFLIIGSIRFTFHLIAAVSLLYAFFRKVFKISIPKGESVNYAKNENTLADTFLRMYMLEHVIGSVINMLGLCLI